MLSSSTPEQGGSCAPKEAVAALLERLQLPALDPQSPTGIFDGHGSGDSSDRWRSYRDQIIGRWSTSADPEN